jgi:hypothetical protein
MTTSIIVGLFVGILIGLRFKVFMVIPAMFMASLFAIAMTAHGNGLWTVIGAATLSVIAVQIGYLCGTASHIVEEAAMTAGTQAPAHSVGPFSFKG